MSTHTPRRGGSSDFTQFEGLESRIVLSAPHDLAIVGMTFDATAGFVPYIEELTWAQDRSITGNRTPFGDAGPGTPIPTNTTDLINGPSGSLIPFYETPQFPDTTSAARFIADEAYPLGWIGGSSGAHETATADVAAVVERSADAQIADLVGSWSMQITHITSAGVFTRLGQASINAAGGFFSLATGATGDPVWVGEGFEFEGPPDNGRFDIRMGSGDSVVMYLSVDKSVILLADLDGRDGDGWMGIGIRQGFALTDAEVAGSYRAGVLYEGQDAVEGANMSDLDDGVPVAAWQIDLATDGTFKMYDLDAADRGDFSQLAGSGTWTQGSGIVTLTDTDTGIRIQITLSDNGTSGLITQFTQQSPAITERPMAIVTKVTPDPDNLGTVLTAGIFNKDGKPVVFDLREASDSWSVVDVERYARDDLAFAPASGLGANPADIEAFEASDGRLIAAITTDDGLFAMQRDDAGFWRLRNLTDSLPGADNIISNITVFTDNNGVSYVAGTTQVGDMVTYVFDPGANSGEGVWSYTNISVEQLAPKNQTTPVFVGPLISYVTAWNGLNIAGLDADGNIQAVWSGNGGAVWNASNLSTITGAPAMASGLTAYLTDWQGINIIGLDDHGQVLATWWVPAFVGNWRVSDLTAISGGPALTGSSLTSFVAPWGALNIAGLDANGDIQAYWWTETNDQWQVANLTAAIAPGDPKPAEQLQSQTNLTYGGELNVLGTDPGTGDLLRLYFRVDTDQWIVQNVTTDAEFV